MIHMLLLFFIFLGIVGNLGVLYVSPTIGLLSTCLTIIAYLWIAIYDIYETKIQEVFSLCSAFLIITLISIYFHFSGIYVTSLVTYAILFFISITYCLKIFHEKRLFHFKQSKYFPVVIPLGILFGGVIYYAMGFSQFSVMHLSLAMAIPLILLIGITESIFFQALLQQSVAIMTDTVIAITFGSILYGIFHFSSNLYITLLFIVLNLLYSVIYRIWNNIYIIIGLHLVIDITFYLLTSNLLIFALR